MSAPRLSDGLTGPRDGSLCQNCSDGLPLKCWQECNEDGIPEPRYVVLCWKCSQALVEPHPRIYRKMDLADHPERLKRSQEEQSQFRAWAEPAKQAWDEKLRAKESREQKEEFLDMTPWLIGLIGLVLLPIVMPVGVVLLSIAVAMIAHLGRKGRK